jgi:prephenate dehydrogenase
MIRRLVVVGVGLIGGSFALALKKAQAVQCVVGVGRSRGSLEEALRLGVIDEAAQGLEAVAGADLVMIATPVAQIRAILHGMLPHLPSDALVTDAGSTKTDVVSAAREALRSRIGQFVPGHPVAGAEKSGAAAARPELFAGRRVIFTPLPENPPAVLERLEQLWVRCGARVSRMAPHEHDQLLAAVSHLPHVLAYALVGQISRDPRAEQLWDYAAGGFRDFTRIASSHPEMWRDICVSNQAAILRELDRYQAELGRLRGLIGAGDGRALEAAFRDAAAARDAWLARFNAGS